MIQEVAEECGIETIMKARNLIQKGIHVVGMTVNTVEIRSIIQKGIHVVGMTMNTVESETDMKAPGEHLVCNCYFSAYSCNFLY